MIGLDKSKNQPVRRERWKVAVNCTNHSCSWQYSGQCRAHRIDIKGGVVDCPMEDMSADMRKVPSYGDKRRVSK